MRFSDLKKLDLSFSDRLKSSKACQFPQFLGNSLPVGCWWWGQNGNNVIIKLPQLTSHHPTTSDKQIQ